MSGIFDLKKDNKSPSDEVNKDWTGNYKSIFTTLGASNHTSGDREKNDYYATHPKATEFLLELETFDKNILEPACGEGHIGKVLEGNGYNVTAYDIVDRGYGGVKNFFDLEEFNGDIITNPPYKFAQEFVEQALKIIPEGNKVAMYLKVQFLEGKSRKKLFLTNPPKVIWVTSSRLGCAKNGDFEKYGEHGAIAYAWYIWEKGYTGDTIVKWFN